MVHLLYIKSAFIGLPPKRIVVDMNRTIVCPPQGQPNVFQGDQSSGLFNQPPPGNDSANSRNSAGAASNSGQ